MKRFVAFLTFKIGVDVLGFPLYWHHQVFIIENNDYIKKQITQNVHQTLSKQH